MRILIITNYFWPENFRINDLAIGLKEKGHDVSVFTGIPNYPKGRFYDGYGIFKPIRQNYKGIKVFRAPLIPRGNGTPIKLALNYLSSALFFSILAPFNCRRKFDVIFVFEVSPITIGLPAILIKKMKSIPLVFWVLDLWPESLSAAGGIRSSIVLKFVRNIVKFIYNHCDSILVSSKGFIGSIMAMGNYNNKIEYFPNWVEPIYLQKEYQNNNIPELPDGFKVMFAGNIGEAQDFETILKTAKILKTYDKLHWIILGDGRKAKWVKKQIQKMGLEKQFHLLGQYPEDTMPAFLSQADALLLTLKNEYIFKLTTPGKLQSYMACGKPIIVGQEGEAARLVSTAGAGLSCPAESPKDLAATVMKIYEMHPDERIKMGKKSHEFCKKHYDRERLIEKLQRLMAEISLNYK